MTTMRYGEYIAKIDYEEDSKLFHGRIVNLRDVVNFYGSSAAELEEEFKNSVDAYLEVCHLPTPTPIARLVDEPTHPLETRRRRVGGAADQGETGRLEMDVGLVETHVAFGEVEGVVAVTPRVCGRILRMQTAMITDWQWSPPALGLALTRSDSSSSRPAMDEQMVRECIGPTLEAETSTAFLREVSRRLPLFTALHMKLLDEVAATLGPTEDLPAIFQGYRALEAEIRQWAVGLDDVTQAELEIALSALNRGNELLRKAVEQAQEPCAAGVVDLFRAAVLAEYLLSCLWRLVELGEQPPIVVQLIYNLRYAALDHAAAVRGFLRHSEEPTPEASSSQTDPEDTFWATVARLPLTELEDAA